MKEQVKKGLLFAIAYVILKWTVIGLVGTYLYMSGLWSNWLLMIIPLIGLTAFSLQKKAKSEIAFKKYFKTAINKHLASESIELLDEVDRRYKTFSIDTAFARKSSNPMDKRLDVSAYFLALIQTLEIRGQTYGQIKGICLEIASDYVSPKNNFQKWLKKVPAKLVGLRMTRPLIRLLHKKVSVKGDPDGFRAEIITDKTETYNLGYGIDIRECGICKLFQKHNARQYASILCEVDKVTSALAGLQLIRNSTIAYGAPLPMAQKSVTSDSRG
jgi:hypothetical protein